MENKIVYNKHTGKIITKIPKKQDTLIYFHHYPNNFKESLAELELEKYPLNLRDYKVINNELVKMTDEEISEIRQYGKIFTEEERQLEKLKPTQEEVKKAENTIEVLTLIQEVM